MSRSRDFGAAASSLAAPSSANNGYAYVVDTTQSSGWNLSPYNNFNWLINGAADHWQRGTTWTADLKFIADRWFWCDTSGGGQSTDVPAGQGFKYSMSFSNSATGHYPRLDYYMHSDDAAFLAGKVVTFSFWAKNGGGTAQFSFEHQYPTTANNFGGAVNNLGGATLASTNNFSTLWQKYSVTFTVDSSAATQGLLLHIFRTTESASTTLATGFKLELGSVATSFIRNGGDRNGELLKCQAYYQRIGGETGYQKIGWGLVIATNSVQAIYFPSVSFRVAPTATPDFSNLGFYNYTANYPVTGISYDQSTTRSVSVNLTTAGSPTLGTVGHWQCQGSLAGYFALSAEVR
jgi:hypothetical protein